MDFIIASIAYVAQVAYLYLLTFAAFALAVYIMAAIVELCLQLLDSEARKSLGVHTLKDMHNLGVYATSFGTLGAVPHRVSSH